MDLFDARRTRHGKAGHARTILFVVAELTLWAAVCVSQTPWNNMHHFTWWGVTMHIACLLWLLCTNSATHFVHDVCMQCIVITGVWYMSACECHMLIDAENEAGLILYTVGNFVIHYMPMLSAYAHIQLTCSTPNPGVTLLWMLYNILCSAHDIPPNHTYGCNVPESTVILLGICVSLTSAWIFYDTQCATSLFFVT